MRHQREKSGKTSDFDFGSAIALGVSFGLIFGMLMDNIGLGLGAGLLLATVANAFHEKRQKLPRANIALTISTGALLVVVLVVFLSVLGIL
jgi:hypothetical protein